MSDSPRRPKDLRIRNVSLHSRGQRQEGSLYLTKYHLIFSYLPDGASNKEQQSGSSLRPSNGIHAAETAPLRPSHDEKAHEDWNETHSSQSAPKLRPKEIWVPYPLINSCVLRASHIQGSRRYDQETHSQDEAEESSESAFPPVYGTSTYSRPSTDSVSLAPQDSPRRVISPSIGGSGLAGDASRVPVIRIRRRDFQMMAFHFHSSSSTGSSDEAAKEVFYCMRNRCCAEDVQSMHSFHFAPPQQEAAVGAIEYDARREFSRMGIGEKSAEGPGSGWRLSDINRDYIYSPTYPSVLCVPRSVSDNMLKYGGSFRSKSRIPALTYLHSNGGSITRSSQPMVGIQSKRNPQDERLVTAIFSSHLALQQPDEQDTTQSSAANGQTTQSSENLSHGSLHDVLETPVDSSDVNFGEKSIERDTLPPQRIYGSTRRTMIVDARPRVNALANKATGGGIEDVANYSGPSGTVVERVFLNIANIHAMRKSLDKVIESFANSDYLNMKPNQELLRNSGWLGHISNLLDGAEMVARAVGLGGSHVLVHCSDGWDRTSQVAALAEIMLDPYYRTLQGFMVLIQKDFLSFGHKFNHRHGILGSDKWFEIENERVAPARTKEMGNADSTGLNKAFSGAKSWFEKNRSSLFRQQNDTKSTLDGADSRPPSPPSNNVLHSTATTSTKEDKEHKTDTKEIAPIFHQFLDAVFQLQHQHPKAFEFNERFLRRLFYQAHAGQYGEFLFNNEKSRGESAGRFCSVWPHFISRKQEFTNLEYVAKAEDLLLLPRRQSPSGGVEVRWWSALFGRNDEDMNSARALAPPDPDVNIESPRISGDIKHDARSKLLTPPHGGAPKEVESLSSVRESSDSVAKTMNSIQLNADDTTRSVLKHPETASEMTAGHSTSVHSVGQSTESDGSKGITGGGELDIAAFAKQSAFSER